MLGHFAEGKASLATSFQCKLNNYAYIIGDQGTIVINDFWRATSCQLYVIEELVDSFEDNRTTLGFNFEAQAMVDDILNGKLEPDVVSHQRSVWLQQQDGSDKSTV